MKKCYTNIKLIKPDGGVTSGYIITDNNKISDVVYFNSNNNKNSNLVPELSANITKNAKDIEIVDCQDSLLIPGLINMHTHSAMTFLRSRADDKPLERWLNEDVFPNEAKLTIEDQIWFAKLAILEYLQSGTTCIFDMYLSTKAMAKAAKDMHFRTVICGSVNDYGGTAKDLRKDIEKYGGHNNSQNSLISFRLGFHAIYTTNKTLLKKIAKLSKKLHEPVWTHLCETKTEVNNCLNENGVYPFIYLNKLGIFKQGGGAFHCVHLTQGDRKVIKKRNLTIVTCPGSNLKLGSGIIDLPSLVAQNTNICIGTDGPASNNQLSILREMYLASILYKNSVESIKQFATCPFKQFSDNNLSKVSNTSLNSANLLDFDALSILNSATKNSAKALNINAGHIEIGALADFTLISQKNVNTLLNDPIKNLIFSLDTKNVVLTVVDGEIRYNNLNNLSEFILPNNQNASEIYEECKKRHKRIFS